MINLSNTRLIKISPNEFKKYALEKGDILITRVNGSLDIVGSFCLIPSLITSIAYCDHFIRMRLMNACICEEYIYLLGNIRYIRQAIASKFKTTSGQKTINQGHLDNLLIPLPPLGNQHRIVAKLNSLLSLCDSLDQSIKQSKFQTDKLLQAVLRESLKS
jgi:type I restriction enzyme S subunit